MLELGWSEILIIGVVSLIVVGPKDLPKMLQTLGKFAGRAKGIAREFRNSMDEAARQADIEELQEVKKGFDDLRGAQHKMQRDLSRSILDDPEKSNSKKPAAKAAAKPTAPAASAPSKPAKAPARKTTTKISEPQTTPDSMSGA